MKKFNIGGVLTSSEPLIGAVSASEPLKLNTMALQNATLGKTGSGALGRGWNKFKGTVASANLNNNSGISKSASTGNIIGQAADITSTLIGRKEPTGKYADLKKAGDKAFDSASNIVMMINPLVGGIMKVGGLVSDITSKFGNYNDAMTKSDAILGSKLLSLTPAAMINNFGGKKSRTFTVDQNIANNSSYTGTGKFISDAGTLSGKKYGLYSSKARKKANRKMDKAQGYQDTIDDILTDASDKSARAASSSDMFANKLQLEQSGGLNNIRFGRDGFKFLESFRIKYAESQKNILKYKDGGKIGEKNIIPEGKLHKELHHLDTEDISRKGIPVILKEGDKISQVAEIEREELILRLEVTEKLEELYKEDTDEAAIEAGKLLVKEILHNTIDKGKVIKETE